MAMAGEHPIPGREQLQWLPHPPPVGPYSCALLSEFSQGGPPVSGALLSGLGGPAESGDLGVGAWLGSPVLSLCLSNHSMFDLTAGDLPPTRDPADPRTPDHTP